MDLNGVLQIVPNTLPRKLAEFIEFNLSKLNRMFDQCEHFFSLKISFCVHYLFLKWVNISVIKIL